MANKLAKIGENVGDYDSKQQFNLCEKKIITTYVVYLPKSA
jgi:hypothetical protein